MNKKYKAGCFIAALFFLIQPCLSRDKIIIFKEDKPDIKLFWGRMSDYSPTLRLVDAAEFSPDGKYVAAGSWAKLTGEGHYDIFQRQILDNKDLK